MKEFLIGFAIWFALAWIPHFIKDLWVSVVCFFKHRKAKKKNNTNELWMYEV